MGLTFKENCTDLRNSGIQGVIRKLRKFKCNISLHDPWANNIEIKKKYGIFPKTKFVNNTYDAVLVAVAHKNFKKLGFQNILKLCKKTSVIYDLKYLFRSS